MLCIYFCLYNLYPETFFELNGFTLMGLLLYGTHNKIFEVLYVLKLRSIFLQVNGYHGETFGYIVQCSTLCPEGVESQKVKTSSCNA